MKYHAPDDDAGEMENVERQLRSLQPRPASRELQRRIAGRLEDAPLMPLRWYAPLAMAASLAIAATLTALLLAGGRSEDAGDNGVAARMEAVPSLDLSQPTLIAYHRALADSERALDRMLDEHARRNRDAAATSPESSSLMLHQRLPL